VAKQAKSALIDFLQAQNGGVERITQPVLQPPIWQKPPPGILKLNWDVAIDRARGITRVGLVVRDSNGQVVVASTRHFPILVEASIGEALGAWCGVSLSSEWGFQNMIFEGDSMEVVSALLKTGPDWSCKGTLIDDIKALFHRFNIAEVRHVKRMANTGAHLLAKFALSCNDSLVWREMCPPPIQSVIVA